MYIRSYIGGSLMKKRILIIFAVLILFIQTVFASQNAQPLPANKIYENNVNSILFVETQESSGSGIILDDTGTFVTCFHVIGNADNISVTTKDGNKYKVRGFKYLNPADDIAILTINSRKKFTPVSINHSGYKVGDNIYTIGNPQDIKFVFNNGIINKIIEDDIIQFSAPTSPGSSGSALFDNSGNLIGMVISQYNPSVAQNINFAIANSKFLPYLSKKTKANTKHLSWSEFLSSRLSEKNLKEFIAYALSEDDYVMLFKYSKSIITPETTPPDDYAFYGTMAIAAYMSDYDNNKFLIDEAIKWYTASINAKVNEEISLFGLIQALMMKRDLEKLNEYEKQLKKYHKSYKFLKNCYKEVDKCNYADDKLECGKITRAKILNYLYSLASDIYGKNKTNPPVKQ